MAFTEYREVWLHNVLAVAEILTKDYGVIFSGTSCSENCTMLLLASSAEKVSLDFDFNTNVLILFGFVDVLYSLPVSLHGSQELHFYVAADSVLFLSRSHGVKTPVWFKWL